jgi:hypothetical protein
MMNMITGIFILLFLIVECTTNSVVRLHHKRKPFKLQRIITDVYVNSTHNMTLLK